MRWWPILEEFSPELIYIEDFKNIVAVALSRLDKIFYLNKNNSNNNKIEPTFENLSENFGFNKRDVLHPTSLETIKRFQQKDKSLIEIAKEKPNDYSIKQFHGVGKMYPLIRRHEKIVIPKQIQKTLVE